MTDEQAKTRQAYEKVMEVIRAGENGKPMPDGVVMHPAILRVYENALKRWAKTEKQ